MEIAFAWIHRMGIAARLLATEKDPLLAAALRAGAAPDGVSPVTLFRRLVVEGNIPADPQALPTPQTRSKTRPDFPPTELPGASAALRSLPSLAQELTVWSDALFKPDLTDPLVLEVARTLVEEHRLRRPSAARATAAKRIASHLSARSLPHDALLRALDTLAAHPAWLHPEPAASLQKLRESTPDIEAANLLLTLHRDIAADAARRVYAHDPDYAKLTGGPIGEKKCAKDNAYTLHQLALILLEGHLRPAEKLQEWWSAVVGIHIINRPPHLFTRNLHALHAALERALPERALDRIFPILHQLYKEGIGIPDSPLLLFGNYHPKESATLTPFTLPDPKLHLRRISALAAGPATLAKDWSAWLAHPNLDGLGALATQHGADPVLRALALLLGDLTRKDGPDAPTTHLAATLPGRLAAWLLADHLEKIPVDENDKCARDLALLHRHFAHQLRTKPTDQAVLQTHRFLIELVGPHLIETPEVWAQNITRFGASITPSCPTPARPLLDRWLRQLDHIGPRLLRIQPLFHVAFPAGFTTFHPDFQREKRLRGALTAALLPGIATDCAPWPGHKLRRLAPAPTATDTEALIAFLDRHFDRLDGDCYYEVLDLVGAKAEPTPPASPRSDALLQALAAPPPRAGLLNSLFGPPKEHLAHDLALAALLAASELRDLWPTLAPEPLVPATRETLLAWSRLNA